MTYFMLRNGKYIHVLRIVIPPAFVVIEMQEHLAVIIRVRGGGMCQHIARAIEWIAITVLPCCPANYDIRLSIIGYFRELQWALRRPEVERLSHYIMFDIPS